ncbi:hypothetical protein MMC25_002148 [Agyrium rufum]|nr:hypothetical protein [Agyrium rufum]
MSLYYEAETFSNSGGPHSAGSLKSRVFTAKSLQSTPAQIFALVTEATRWSPVLKEVVEKSELLQHEKKLTPVLSILLVHDLLLSKKGIAANATHPLRLAVQRHKARLSSELTRARIRKGCTSIEELKKYLQNTSLGVEELDADNGEPQAVFSHPRWVRINVLKTSLEEQLRTTFAGFRQVENLSELLLNTARDSNLQLLHVDKHVPDLIALPIDCDLSRSPAYLNGHVVFQDKASCFPAYLLNPSLDDGDCLDACAAPGNKTTHLVSILHSMTRVDTPRTTIWACERDTLRSIVLQKMVTNAGADAWVKVKPNQNFLHLDPEKEPWASIGALLLDPSCSGSGIVGQDDAPLMHLPSTQVDKAPCKASRKRKRAPEESAKAKAGTEIFTDENAFELVDTGESLKKRLGALAAFQLRLLLHAFSFPSARKVTYSTCSVHAEENENVVVAALQSPVATARGWRILPREDQVSGLRDWVRRGDAAAVDGAIKSKIWGSLEIEKVAEACIRCDKGTCEGTQGFFVAAFRRVNDCEMREQSYVEDGDEGRRQEEDDEWSGIED